MPVTYLYGQSRSNETANMPVTHRNQKDVLIICGFISPISRALDPRVARSATCTSIFFYSITQTHVITI